MLSVSIKPVNKLLRASERDYITWREFLQTCARASSVPQKYTRILTELKIRLRKSNKISKKELIDATNEILISHGYGLRSHKHPILCPNTFWPAEERSEVYDQALYGSAPNAAPGHCHTDDGDKSLFYFRCEPAPVAGNLLIGNIQPTNWFFAPRGVHTSSDFKRIMVHAALNHAQQLGRESVTFQAGRALVAAQNWKEIPAKRMLVGTGQNLSPWIFH